jgi:sugar phosphate permease
MSQSPPPPAPSPPPPAARTHPQALATVTAIIDGMGSIGAAIGPVLTGYIAEAGGFDGVFMMLYIAALAAGALLVRLCMKELQTLRLSKGHLRVPSGVQLTGKV